MAAFYLHYLLSGSQHNDFHPGNDYGIIRGINKKLTIGVFYTDAINAGVVPILYLADRFIL